MNEIQKGVTVMETAVSVFVIAILVSGLGTAVYSTVLDARSDSAIDQLLRLKKAIVGEPQVIPPGERNLIRYGYVGDMGSLPASLANLENAGTQPDYAVDSGLQIGVGWRGPYIPSALATLLTDPWGRSPVYTVASGASSTTGAPTVATLRSLGPDGQSGTPDDHVVEIYKSEALSRVVGYVKDATGGTVPGVKVKLSHPNGGILVSPAPSAVTDDQGLYAFDDIPHGERVLQLEPKLSFQRGTGFTTGTDRNNVELFVENLSKDSTTITTLKITYLSNPPSDFAQILLNGGAIGGSSGNSGTTVSFSSQAVAGTGVIQEPFRIEVGRLVMQVPDAVIGTAGTGGTLKIEINDFEETGTNNNVDMTGVTFTLEFSDGSKTLFAPIRKP